MLPPFNGTSRIACSLRLLQRLQLQQQQHARYLHRTRSEMADGGHPYSEWSNESLIARVESLEKQLKEQNERYRDFTRTSNSPAPSRSPRNPRVNREFNPTRYSTRFIALKLAYLGQNYNGLEYHHNNKTRLPTVEEVLWKALNKARLIITTPDPSNPSDEVTWDGCEYSKSGRTDRGVSAFGQVMGIRVRSNKPLERITLRQNGDVNDDGNVGVCQRAKSPHSDTALHDNNHDGLPTSSSGESSNVGTPPFDLINDEIPYAQVLNRLLPPDIRILAWCPSPPKGFSARFSCKERRYKYFFTQPAFTPTIGKLNALHGSNTQDQTANRRREGWLDLGAMKNAAKKFEGLHDFRNFCKLDPTKQTENFERRIFYSDIQELDPRNGPAGYIGLPGFQEYQDSEGSSDSSDDSAAITRTPKIYTFTLHGSAFLWHQVRHMAAILFLIGQGLESPSLIEELLDVSTNPRKPQYEMADDAPLVLWDCIFPREGGDPRTDALEWVHVGDYTGQEKGVAKVGGGKTDGKYGLGGLVDGMWKVWRQRKMDEVLAGVLIDAVVGQAGRDGRNMHQIPSFRGSQKVFAGGNAPRLAGRYVPVMERPKMDRVEEINARYVARKSAGGEGEDLAEA